MPSSIKPFWIIAAVIAYALPWAYALKAPGKVPASVVSVAEFFPRADGSSDDTPAFQAAFAEAARRRVPLHIPQGVYAVSAPLAVQSGMIIRADGAEIRHLTHQGALLKAENAHDWLLQGPLTLKGNGSNTGEAETGLLIAGARHYAVDKLTVRDFAGSGIEIESGLLNWEQRGDHGQFAFVSLLNNGTGLKINDSIGAEYNLFSVVSFSGNATAASIAGGSNIISVANVVDNANGIELVGGSNHGHGVINAANINHNKGFNVKASDVANGYSLNACHIYGDSESEGIIRLSNSQGISITSSALDAALVIDGGRHNSLSGSYVAGKWFAVSADRPDLLMVDHLFSAEKELAIGERP
jgi:hypothetical protein